MNNYANTQMVKKLNAVFPLKPEIKEAFLKIDRKEFVPESFIFQAYVIDSLPLATDSTISSPLTVAKMTTYLEIDKSVDSVLEIGCGSGYQAAILSQLIRRVFTVERIRNLVIKAKNRFKKLNIHNINLKYDDGNIGWKNYAPFDRILFSATATEIPKTLFEQLNNNGILIAPILKENREIITQFKKQNGRIYKKELEECKFVPIKKGKE